MNARPVQRGSVSGDCTVGGCLLQILIIRPRQSAQQPVQSLSSAVLTGCLYPQSTVYGLTMVGVLESCLRTNLLLPIYLPILNKELLVSLRQANDNGDRFLLMLR